MIRLFQGLQTIAKARYEGKNLLSVNEMTSLLNERIREERWWVQLSTARVEEILQLIQECGLCTVQKNNIILFGTAYEKSWKEWEQAVTHDLARSQRDEWWGVHQFLYHSHSVYRSFYDLAREGAYVDSALIAKDLGLKPLRTHPTVVVLTEWELKLGRFQRNVLTGAYYVLREPTTTDFPLEQDFSRSLCMSYLEIKKEEKEFAVSLPKVQEYVCQRLQITRSKFNLCLAVVQEKNTRSIFLESGIIPSYAYRSSEHQKEPKPLLRLDAIPQNLWFESSFFYTTKDWEDIVVNNEVKRFIRIENDFLERFTDAKGVDSPEEA